MISLWGSVRWLDPDDGRAIRIALTRRGRAVVERAMSEHVTRAGEVAQRLTANEQAQLAAMLRKLLLSFEAPEKAASARKGAASCRRVAAI